MRDEPTIHDYLDAAAARISKLYNLPKVTDRELGRRLGVSHAAVSAYRKDKALPDDDTMVKLAELADMNIEAALAWLNCWRNKGEVSSVYSNLARRLGRSAAALGFCFGLFGGAIGVATAPRPAHAAPRLIQLNQPVGEPVVSHNVSKLYIMRLARLLRTVRERLRRNGLRFNPREFNPRLRAAVLSF